MTNTKTLKKRLEPECIGCMKENYDAEIDHNVPCLRALALPYKYFEEIIGCPIYRKAMVKIDKCTAFLIVEEELK